MDQQTRPVVAHHEMGKGSVASYTIGFILSIIFTIIPYYLVVHHVWRGAVLIAMLFACALIQLMVQLVFFLHLGRESKPRWNLLVFLFAVMVVLIVVIGSLWIMKNLDYNMMPHEVDEYLLDEEGIRK